MNYRYYLNYLVNNWQALLRLSFLTAVIITTSAGLGVLSVLYFQVYFGDDSQLQRESILAKINEETAIYYLDEKTEIGSFFSTHHRRYIPIDEIPAHVINAFIASEDKYFYEHTGINPIAIVKAIMEGLSQWVKSGFRVLHFRGGSTITQQTVKNILDRREYSLSRKFREAVAALQLERLYTKREILEFYLNQFHVTSNGNGIGIAAKYYFDKDVRDLNLVEAAFIAGSVKGPSKYNPFIKYTAQKRAEAIAHANERKNYVITRMFEQGWITAEEYRDALQKPVPFKRGKFTNKEVALLSLIKSQINRQEILQALNMDHISELNHSGLKIYTTLDHDIQNASQLEMRRHLSRLETILQGFAPESEDNFTPLRDLEINEFYFGKVEKVVYEKGEPKIILDFGLATGEIPYPSLVRYAKLLDLAIQVGWQKRLKELVSRIKPGMILFVEIREYDPQTHHAIVELQKRPIINGALVVLDKGEVRALVSGFDAQGYNRAIFGKRQPGSVFKSVVYFAALQLGWSMLSSLDNQRRVFPYQGQFYYPQPDHDSPYDKVSMIWSGTKSENLAAIYLTAHLIDQLNFNQFKGLLERMDLAPNPGESEREYHYRVARKIGVQLDNEGIKEFELQNTIQELAPDLIFNGHQNILKQLDKMWWGRGYLAELQRLYTLDPEEYSRKEKLLRIELVKNNYQRMTTLATYLRRDFQFIKDQLNEIGPERLLQNTETAAVLSRFRVVAGSTGRPELAYFQNLQGEDPVPNAQNQVFILDPFPGRALNVLDIQSIWGGERNPFARAHIRVEDVKLNGYLPLNIFVRLQERLQQRFDKIVADQEPYKLNHYYHHHDFRIAVGLHYLKGICEQMGVFSKIEPVLSFPLGTNVVSVAEVAKIYQTFIDGKVYQFYKEGPVNQINLIRRIEDRNGQVLFEAKRKEAQLSRPEYAYQMREILRKVVTHGTGRRAHSELYLKLPLDPSGQKIIPIRVPAFGKTGTTNDYRTASFAGFLPYPTQKKAPLNPSNSYVIASYVGYDLNREMRRGGYKISGAYGALPVWTDVAKDIIHDKKYIDYLDRLDINIISRKSWPLAIPQNTAGVKVDLPRGLILRADESVENLNDAVTDYSSTGEEYINEFALNSGIESIVRLPVNRSAGRLSPLTIVDPYRLIKPEELWSDQNAVPNTQDMNNTVDTATLFPSPVDPNAKQQLDRDLSNPAQDIEKNMDTDHQQNNTDITRGNEPEHTQTKAHDPKTTKMPAPSQPAQNIQPPVQKAVDPDREIKNNDSYIEEELW